MLKWIGVVVVLATTFVSIAVAGPYEDAISAYHRGDYATAQRLWKRLAKKGNAAAQNNLGSLYAVGHGVQKDYAQAEKWFRFAAAQGLAEAQFSLGLMYNNGDGVAEDYALAAEWYGFAAAQGYAAAQSNLATLYYNGRGLPQDYAQAAKWYRLAAAQGLAEAQYALGVINYGGHGVSTDYAGAENWFRLAATQGIVEAEFMLGIVFQFGLGVLSDKTEALFWYSRAAEKGFADAKHRIEEIEKGAVPNPEVFVKPQSPEAAGGATLEVRTVTQNGREKTLILIDGQLFPGDEIRFINTAISVEDAVVLLNSPGGDLQAGIEIGTAIRLKGFATMVSKGFECASACALAWLGGSPRLMEDGSSVGFHAASVTATGDVSSVGNALVGAYLSKTLSLSLDAIVYVTQAQPDEIEWLRFEQAAQIGIAVDRP